MRPPQSSIVSTSESSEAQRAVQILVFPAVPGEIGVPVLKEGIAVVSDLRAERCMYDLAREPRRRLKRHVLKLLNAARGSLAEPAPSNLHTPYDARVFACIGYLSKDPFGYSAKVTILHKHKCPRTESQPQFVSQPERDNP